MIMNHRMFIAPSPWDRLSDTPPRPAWSKDLRIESTPREEGFPDFHAMMTEQPRHQMKDTYDLRYFPGNVPALGTEIMSGTTDDAGTTIQFRGRAFVNEIGLGQDFRNTVRVTIEINFAASAPDEPSPRIEIEHPIYSRSGEVAGRVSGVKYPPLEITPAPAEKLSCAFCGGSDIRFDRHPEKRRGIHVGEDVWSTCCYQCGATFPNMYSKEKLVEKWKLRPGN